MEVGDIVVLSDSYFKLVNGSKFTKESKYELMSVSVSVMHSARSDDDLSALIKCLENGYMERLHYSWLRDMNYHRDRQISNLV